MDSRALEGSVDGLVVFMHDPLYDLGGTEPDMNRGGAPEELLDAVEHSSSLSALTAVFWGRHTSQALLPDGPFGALHVGAGGGGAPAEDLRRWGPAEGTPRKDDLVLEPLFDLAMQEALTEWNSQSTLPDLVIDQARAQNSFEGFRASYDSAHFPIFGWWQVEMAGSTMKVVFWHYQAQSHFGAEVHGDL